MVNITGSLLSANAGKRWAPIKKVITVCSLGVQDLALGPLTALKEAVPQHNNSVVSTPRNLLALIITWCLGGLLHWFWQWWSWNPNCVWNHRTRSAAGHILKTGCTVAFADNSQILLSDRTQVSNSQPCTLRQTRPHSQLWGLRTRLIKRWSIVSLFGGSRKKTLSKGSLTE